MHDLKAIQLSATLSLVVYVSKMILHAAVACSSSWYERHVRQVYERDAAEIEMIPKQMII